MKTPEEGDFSKAGEHFNGLNLVIHGGREEVAVALVRLRRVAWDYYKHPNIASERLLKELLSSKEVVEDRNPTPTQ